MGEAGGYLAPHPTKRKRGLSHPLYLDEERLARRGDKLIRAPCPPLSSHWHLSEERLARRGVELFGGAPSAAAANVGLLGGGGGGEAGC